MAEILNFLLAVGANVLSCYICKWLDGWTAGARGGKHKKSGSPERRNSPGARFCMTESFH